MHNVQPWSTTTRARIMSAALIAAVVAAFIVVDWLLNPTESRQKLFDFTAQALLAGAGIYSAYIAGIALWASVSLQRQANAYRILEELATNWRARRLRDARALTAPPAAAL